MGRLEYSRVTSHVLSKKGRVNSLKDVSLSVAICTKDRPQNVLRCVKMIKQLVPHCMVYVFSGSEHPNVAILDFLVKKFGVTVVPVVGLKFGEVRAKIMNELSEDYVAMIDDDIDLSPNWFKRLLPFFDYSNMAAVQGRIIYGSGGVVTKLSLKALRDDGGSGGASIYDRKKVLAVGNFDKNIHRGEDMELKLRLRRRGYRWGKVVDAFAFHPISSVKDFLLRPRVDVVGWNYILQNSENRIQFFAERFGSLLIMPVYYFWVTLDPRCAVVWWLYRLVGLLCFLFKRYEDWG